MAAMTNGEKWVRLLRAYSPVPDDMATEAEQVDRLAARLGIQRLSFPHPAWDDLEQCYPTDTGDFRTVVLTGTAGDGKTTLCLQLAEKLTGSIPKAGDTSAGFQTFSIETTNGLKKVTMIYDVTGWRRREGRTLSHENIDLLEQAAAYVSGTGGHAFILAVNDGQLHEMIRALPSNCSEELKAFGKELINMHAYGLKDSKHFPSLRLINLSLIPSDLLMKLCLDGILCRTEWMCFEEEKNNPLFGPNSSIFANYNLLNNKDIQEKLYTLARIAGSTGQHLSVRSILILITNAILGHSSAKNGVLRPGTEANNILAGKNQHLAALHLNLFGYNLTKFQRNRREVYKFLSMLHVGEETTNDLDELIIFGNRDEELKSDYNTLVANDPYLQRNPAFDSLALEYIRGDIVNTDEIDAFLRELSHERRRILLHSTSDQAKKYNLWSTTVFHYAGDFVEYILDPIRCGRAIDHRHIQKLVAGLNRVWTGLLMDENAHEIYLASGLDLSTSPISDLLLEEIQIVDEPPGFAVEGNDGFPKAIIRYGGNSFPFSFTLPRFEFLMRVASGAMPSSFSRESYEDFLSLKQCCLRDLQIHSKPNVFQCLDVMAGGHVNKKPIYLLGNNL